MTPAGEDANPLNRRLPAEVVTRKRPALPKKVEEKPPDEVEVDLKVALALKSDARIKWLGKACNMAQEGRADTTDLYDIVANKKFAAGVHPKVGRKIRDVVRDIMSVFSDKQQRHLKSDDWLFNSSILEQTAPVVETSAAPAAAFAAADAADAAVAAARAPAALAADSAAPDDRLMKPRMFFEKASDKAPVDKASADKAAASDKGGWVVAPRQPERMPGPEDRGGWSVVDDRRRKVTDRENRERLLEQEEQSKKEKERAARKKLEAQVDDSMMLLERLEKKKQQEPEPDRASSKRRKRSRSRRSVSVQAMKSRSRSRRRRPDKKMDKAAFSEAIKRRLEEREARDTTRIPVVDPDHAKRWS